ncbi:hypothetical protein WM2015_2965 [Wenzhouxiangella marina]|uniref:Uncharacterized protein n=1 Tax=Wenzhouxiangella marina TaxID=1579979 RepID=A0A0K0Y047_9GAMM|nr:hypothetical protein WM2015_2965 [Wenzhouxiangella marina]
MDRRPRGADLRSPRCRTEATRIAGCQCQPHDRPCRNGALRRSGPRPRRSMPQPSPSTRLRDATNPTENPTHGFPGHHMKPNGAPARFDDQYRVFIWRSVLGHDRHQVGRRCLRYACVGFFAKAARLRRRVDGDVGCMDRRPRGADLRSPRYRTEATRIAGCHCQPHDRPCRNGALRRSGPRPRRSMPQPSPSTRLRDAANSTENPTHGFPGHHMKPNGAPARFDDQYRVFIWRSVLGHDRHQVGRRCLRYACVGFFAKAARLRRRIDGDAGYMDRRPRGADLRSPRCRTEATRIAGCHCQPHDRPCRNGALRRSGPRPRRSMPQPSPSTRLRDAANSTENPTHGFPGHHMKPNGAPARFDDQYRVFIWRSVLGHDRHQVGRRCLRYACVGFFAKAARLRRRIDGDAGYMDRRPRGADLRSPRCRTEATRIAGCHCQPHDRPCRNGALRRSGPRPRRSMPQPSPSTRRRDAANSTENPTHGYRHQHPKPIGAPARIDDQARVCIRPMVTGNHRPWSGRRCPRYACVGHSANACDIPPSGWRRCRMYGPSGA